MGKGSGKRKIQHLSEVKILIEKCLTNFKYQDKLHRIYKLWKNGKSVMICQLNQDTNDFEATSKEYSLIRALKLDFLTNKRNSSPYGAMKYQWRENEIINFGKLMVFKCLEKVIEDPPYEIYYKDLFINRIRKKETVDKRQFIYYLTNKGGFAVNS